MNENELLKLDILKQANDIHFKELQLKVDYNKFVNFCREYIAREFGFNPRLKSPDNPLSILKDTHRSKIKVKLNYINYEKFIKTAGWCQKNKKHYTFKESSNTYDVTVYLSIKEFFKHLEAIIQLTGINKKKKAG